MTLAAIVVFTTTYMLILPAFTLDSQSAAEQGGIDVPAVETTAEDTSDSTDSAVADEKAAANDANANANQAEASVETKADQSAEKADAKAKEPDESAAKVKAADPEKSDVKLLTGKKTITAAQGKGDDFAVSAVVSTDAKVPADVTITATELGKNTDGFDYDQYKDDALAALKKDSSDVRSIKSIKFYDISLESDSQDKSVEPSAPVSVKISYDNGMKVSDADNIRIVHFAEQKNGSEKAQVLDANKNNVETTTAANGSKVTEASFDTDGFSKYAVVEVEIIEKTVITADGKTYKVSVSYGKDAGIPEGSTLEVKELTGDDYDAYLEKAASKLDKNADDLGMAKFFDITIRNGDDEVKIASPVDVEIKLLDSDSLADSTQVLHFSNEDKADVVDSKVDGDTVKFEAEGFSVYAVIDGSSDENARVPVEFYNGETKIATMYIKNGDILLGEGERLPNVSYLEDIIVDPGVGTIGNEELFRGWSTKSNYTVSDASSAMTIEGVREYLAENVIGNITEGDEPIKIYAMIYKYFDVTYFGLDEGISLGSDTVLLLRDENQASYQVSMPFTAESNAKFMGWKAIEGTYANIVGATDPETVYPNTTSITITDDVEFKVYAPTGHWLVYNENAKGATYNAPGFYLDGENTVQPSTATGDNMHRNGYSFGGWYKLKDGQELTDADKDEDGNYIIGNKFEQFNFGSPLEPVVTNIYAKWTPNKEAPYTIVFWTENIGSIHDAQADKEYDLTASYNGTGTVGQNIPYTFVNNGDEDYVRAGGNNYHYTGFSLIPGSVNQQITITPEGDAVLNLYYNRIQYDLRFYLYRRNGNGNNDYQFAQNSANGNNIWGVVNWWGATNLANMPTTTYPGGIKSQSGVGGNNITGYYIVLSAYYGEDIADRWPTYDLIGNGRSGNTNYSPVSYVMMVGTKLKPNPSAGGDGTLKGVYNRMDENILGATNDADGNFLIVRFNTYNNWTYHCYYEAYDGQDLTGKTTRTLNGKTYYLDHDFTTRSSNTKPGSQNPPQYAGFSAVMQTSSRPYYDQVYINGNLQPANYVGQDGVSGNNCQLNYYYDRLEYPIHYMDGVYVGGSDNTNILGSHPENELHTSANIPYDAEIPAADKNYKPDPSHAHEPGFVFEGWYADAACKVPYNFTIMPNNPIVVYAKWVQTQYRVFLHPNAEDSSTNPDLNWGNENQEMNFRISYGGKVSTPTGIWTGGRKEFIAWFTDEACENNIFDGDVFVLNDETVTEEYDKEDPANYTDDMDQWGNGATYNKDTDRWWITKKLDVYAKWRTVLVGADGIDVVYVAQGTDSTDPETVVPGKVNGNDTYQDPLKYLDNAGAVAGQAAVPEDATNYQFLHWVLQRWDENAGENGEFVDVTNEHGELVTVFPGDSFTVLEEYAKAVETVPDDPSTPDVIETRRTYTVQLRAEYAPNELAKPTYINWFKNDKDPSERLHEDKDLQINEATDIYTVVDGNDIPTREGYKFLGWAREPEYDLDEQSYPIPESHHTAYLNLNADDLYLKYVEPTGTAAAKYQAKNKNGEWVDVTKVAADEATPYHAMYAVWEVEKYKVDIEKIVEGSDDDKNIPFKIHYSYGEAEGEAGDVSLKHGEITSGTTPVQTITDVPYGSIIEVTEPDPAAEDYEQKYEAKLQITTIGENGEENVTDGSKVDPVTINGSSFRITGDTKITVTNTRKSQEVIIKKTDMGTTALEGAKFVYDGTEYESGSDGFLKDSEGQTKQFELKVGEHNFKETKAPDGYLNLQDDVVITVEENRVTAAVKGTTTQWSGIKDDATGVWTVTIQNSDGKELPMTGGIGTTIFYILGSLLVIGCGIVLVSRKRIGSDR